MGTRRSIYFVFEPILITAQLLEVHLYKLKESEMCNSWKLNWQCTSHCLRSWKIKMHSFYHCVTKHMVYFWQSFRSLRHRTQTILLQHCRFGTFKAVKQFKCVLPLRHINLIWISNLMSYFTIGNLAKTICLKYLSDGYSE